MERWFRTEKGGVFKKDDTFGHGGVETLLADTTEYTDDELTAGNEYFYRLSAYLKLASDELRHGETSESEDIYIEPPAHAYAYSDGDVYAYAYPYAQSNAYAYEHPDGYQYAYGRHSHLRLRPLQPRRSTPTGDTYAYSNQYAYPDSDVYADAYPYAHSYTNTDSHAYHHAPLRHLPRHSLRRLPTRPTPTNTPTPTPTLTPTPIPSFSECSAKNIR